MTLHTANCPIHPPTMKKIQALDRPLYFCTCTKPQQRDSYSWHQGKVTKRGK